MHRLQTLIDRLKPVAFVYRFTDEKPTRIDQFIDVGATLSAVDRYEVLTFWFRWDHDWEGDGVEDWEPITYILDNDKVIDIQTRTHWLIVKWMSDNPILENGEKAIVYFSKHGHAPYMKVQSNIGWLKRSLDKSITGYATLDFLEVLDEIEGYVRVTNYKVIANRSPPSTSRAMNGISILGRAFFTNCYKKPKR
ncbi:MAG TPA: hypothetical protein VLH35_05610 [Candidatus Acidoferrales bacterium]|nr:hypothetical protein [Candidatus Acidoferrales bacterium]